VHAGLQAGVSGRDGGIDAARLGIALGSERSAATSGSSWLLSRKRTPCKGRTCGLREPRRPNTGSLLTTPRCVRL